MSRFAAFTAYFGFLVGLAALGAQLYVTWKHRNELSNLTSLTVLAVLAVILPLIFTHLFLFVTYRRQKHYRVDQNWLSCRLRESVLLVELIYFGTMFGLSDSQRHHWFHTRHDQLYLGCCFAIYIVPALVITIAISWLIRCSVNRRRIYPRLDPLLAAEEGGFDHAGSPGGPES